jgi:hypothetical protein
VANDTDVLLGSGEAAQHLGVHRSFIERAVRAGRITPVHRGSGIRGAMLFRLVDVEALSDRADPAATSISPKVETSDASARVGDVHDAAEITSAPDGSLFPARCWRPPPTTDDRNRGKKKAPARERRGTTGKATSAMALTSTTDSLSTIPRTATPKTESFVRAHAVWLAALAVWFLNDFEVPVSGRSTSSRSQPASASSSASCSPRC